MKLSEKEKAARKAAFRAMTTAQKLDHIYTYYKGPILLALAVLIAAGSFLHRKLSEKEPVLYLAQVNVSAGADLERDLTGAYLLSLGADPARQEVFLYRDLYLSDNADTLNHEYAYASRMKLMGVIQSQKLDVVVMNREAYDIFSRNGYLADLTDLPALSDPAYAALLAPLLAECEKWAREKGCTEFASDCELDNADSLRFHLALGFEETNRIICFKKKL